VRFLRYVRRLIPREGSDYVSVGGGPAVGRDDGIVATGDVGQAFSRLGSVVRHNIAAATNRATMAAASVGPNSERRADRGRSLVFLKPSTTGGTRR
jgi:hypothetical protein